MGRPAVELKVTAQDRMQLESIAQSQSLPAALSRRSKSAVHRYLTMFGLQPHRSTSFKLSNDPFFIEEVRDIVGLYLNPPDHALVLCVDEKSQCQDLERTQPVLPMGLGYVEGITHDCVRHGTKTLFAAIGVANGTVRTNMHFVDLTKYFCVRGQCPAVTDNLVEYRDDSHMTVEYPRTLAPMPERKIAGALPAGRL